MYHFYLKERRIKFEITDFCFADLRIFKGQNSIPGEFPHMLSVQEEYDTFIHVCGASIVCERWALTAAHCIRQSTILNGHVRVIAGAWDLKNPSKYQQKVRVDDSVIHPEYTGGGYRVAPHDIALMHLEEPLLWNDWIKPVVLASTINHNLTYAMFSGWGLTSDYPDDVYPNILQRANMRMITLNHCYYASLKLGVVHNFNFDTDICTTSRTGQVNFGGLLFIVNH